ncbi:MAG: PP2C family protein-serine/threonine phosphatase [Candidatus Omnitrophota bacterium]
MPALRYFQLTDRGKLRSGNEDSMIVEDPQDPVLRKKKGVLFAVADGLGGLEHGEIASAKSVLELHRLFKELKEWKGPEWLRAAIKTVNASIHEINRQVNQVEWMATTLTASVFFEDRLYVGHVGDSRLYQIRKGRIHCLTTDHSLDRYTLTRTIGIDPEVEVDLYESDLLSGDVYVQCSDGLYAVVPDEEILRAAERSSPEESCKKLIELANRNGGPDNITVQVIQAQLPNY